MKYKIKQIEQDQKWVAIEVDFEDGSPIYTKRMMADVTSEESIDASVQVWANDFVPARQVNAKPNLSSLINKSKTITVQAKDALAESVK